MISIQPKNGTDIDGIIHEIYRRHTAEYKRYVTASSSSTFHEELYAWGDSLALINYTIKDTEAFNSWVSCNIPNSNFSIYFLQTQIHITHYAFRSRTVNDADMPKNWIVEGSNDNITWNFVDKKEDEQSLLTPKAIKTFSVEKEGIYRYFRFTQHKTNSLGRDFFGINKIDFFGKTIEKFKIISLNSSTNIKLKILCFIILM